MKKALKLLVKPIYLLLILSEDFIHRIGKCTAHLYAALWSEFDIPWFDHRFDHLAGPENWVWAERGVYGSKFIHPGDRVLDVCCGDGIYSGLFYSKFASQVHAIDRDVKSIDFAKKHYSRKNVEFIKADVIKDAFPMPQYDVVVMFAAIEHFSEEQGAYMVRKIATALSGSSNGCFIGSTPIFEQVTGHGHPEHDNEFTSIGQLRGFLSPYFDEIELWTSKWELHDTREEAYFLCTRPKIRTDKVR